MRPKAQFMAGPIHAQRAIHAATPQFIPIAAIHGRYRWTVEDAGPYDVLS